jgi:hypothetical protein
MYPSETNSLRFEAEDGTLIVPLDVYPRWLALGSVHGIRIDLDNPAACSAIEVTNGSLQQRKWLVR